MRARHVLAATWAMGALLLAPLPVHAESTSCGSETILIPDGRIFDSTIPTGTTFWFLFQTQVGRSYSVEARYAAVINSPTVALFGGTTGCTGTPQLTTTDASDFDPGMPFSGSRRTFTATDTGNSGWHRISVSNSTGVTQRYTISVSETTMFSPAWSTSPGYATYYSFFNTTAATLSGTITLLKSDGTSAGSTTISMPAGRTTATNTVALATPAGFAGTAKFTHNGPPGAVLVESDIANFSIGYIQPVKFTALRDAR